MAAEVLWLAVAPALVTGAGLSFLVELLLQPGVLPFWRRPPAAFALHIGLWLLLFAFELLLFRRPWFGIANVLAILILVVLVSNAKYQSLREPFIFQDFEYFTDALKHPRLYLPFFGLGKALLAALGYGGALFVGLTFEPSLTGPIAIADFLIVVAALAVLGIALLWLGARKKLRVVFDPEKDLLQLGLMASLWRYGEEEQERCCNHFPYDFVQPVEEILNTLPNLVVVQSESFFDVRELFAGIRPEILREFDGLKSSAASFGRLQVPAWGANTVRTEFAFLSGLGADTLGVHRFNPYRKLARQGVPTLAGFLQNLGYRTVCVHPYPAGFYNRDKVFPLLGFDEFLDIRSFEGVDKTGPYIGDVALAEKVCDLLGEVSGQPIFVFVITMENHGPLHWEKVREGDVERLYSSPPPESCEDLTIYLRHLQNADRMAGMLRDRMEALPGAGWLCWFGDHVPIMAGVYETMGMPDGQTDYMIWGKGGLLSDGGCSDMEVERLGLLLLQKMSLVM
jgi:hypothetical protein